MRLLPREAWGYAILLIVLCAIGSVATWQTIAYVESLPGVEHGLLPAIIFALTLGFMLIAGAFGLWATRFSAEAESRRRIGRLVDAMHFIADGVVVVDARGRVTGSNPVAGALCGAEPARGEVLSSAFACLSEDDLRALLDVSGPSEMERTLAGSRAPRTLRFRAYPAEGLFLVLISDVTAMNARRLRSRQIARLQLIGQIARGVVHDFNQLLCGISGHAALLRRIEPSPPEAIASAEAIGRAAERGIALVAHLLELSESRLAGTASDLISENVRLAVETLRYTLPREWKIETSIQPDLPPVGVPRMQLEQVVVNLGLLAADAVRTPGTIRITAGLPGALPLLAVQARCAAVVVISAARSEADQQASEGVVARPADDAGVIESVVASLLSEAGGAFEALSSAAGTPVYRLSLPGGYVPGGEETVAVAQEIKDYVASWSLLVAAAARQHPRLHRAVARIGLRAVWADGVADALAMTDSAEKVDGIVVDSRLLGAQSHALLRAVLKLRPEAAVVVLSDDVEGDAKGLEGQIVFVPMEAAPDRILSALVEAKAFAARRARR
jgi:signal transduction histidine kinase